MSGFYVTEDGCVMKGCDIESDNSHGVFLENDFMRGYFVDPTPLVDYTRVWIDDKEGIVNGGFVTWGLGDNSMLECVYSYLTTYPVPRTKDGEYVRKGMTLYDADGNEFVVRAVTAEEVAVNDADGLCVLDPTKLTSTPPETVEGVLEDLAQGVDVYYGNYFRDLDVPQARKRDLVANHVGLRMLDIADGKN
jgi:hypothetical protein